VNFEKIKHRTDAAGRRFESDVNQAKLSKTVDAFLAQGLVDKDDAVASCLADGGQAAIYQNNVQNNNSKL